MTVTEMHYVRTLKGLSPAHVKLVTKEMARSVEVNLKSALMFLISNQLVRPTSNESFYVILQQF